MELIEVESLLPMVVQPVINPVETERTDNKRSPFIEANTVEGNLQIIKDHHTIPAFCKDNEPLISHADFITATYDVVKDFYCGEMVMQPAIRLSHEVNGRIPSAKDKPAGQLEDWEKTIYYQRMMFCIDVPGIKSTIDGNTLSLVVGGVKSYTLDNLYSKKGSDEHFKLYAGFKVHACTNLSVTSDGFVNDLKVTSLGQLKGAIQCLLEGYNQNYNLHHLKKLAEYSITEHQFATLVGRCRMYTHLPTIIKKNIPAVMFGDQQISSVVRDFYHDSNFCRDVNGNINLWRLHNLLTGSNKSSYIDSFLDRSVSAYNFIEQIRWALEEGRENWYLN